MPTLNHQFDSSISEKRFNTLIIEDNMAYRTAIRNLLTTRLPCMDLREAATGKEALSILSCFCPDLVFLDIKLPDLSGLELIKKIKQSHRYAIVIILTAYDSHEYRSQALQSGASHFIVKGSICLADILALVETILTALPLDTTTA